jgi:hypothetical protein
MLETLVAVYIVALAAMPFAHHDLVCHLKSSTHCATCHIGTSADPDAAPPALSPADLNDAGQPARSTPATSSPVELSPSAGRAPPAARTTSIL